MKQIFLRTEKNCCTNTVWLYLCPLRTMVSIAISNEWLSRDPFRDYEVKKALLISEVLSVVYCTQP